MTTSFSDALRYTVPDHQGQEVLGAALLEYGYAWTSEHTGGRTHLVISAPGGRVDREKVREILSGQHRASLSGPDIIYTEVRFEDEPQPEGRPEEARTPVREPGSRAWARPDQVPSWAREQQHTPETPQRDRRRSLSAPLLRAAVGCALLTFPRAITGALIPAADEGDRVLVRLLGARHVAQALVTAARPTETVLTLGAVTDVLHGGTAVAYAVMRADHRRAALVSATVAFGFGASDLRRARG